MRKVEIWNDSWRFVKQAAGFKEAACMAGEEICLPHTWNAKDGQDGGNDYYRGTCYYVKEFAAPFLEPGEKAYLEFRGVNSTADVYINDVLIGHHDGGYSTFRVNITSRLKDKNVLTVAVDNSPNRKVYPQKADFTFYGGIYRDVYLIRVPEVHFDLDYFGGSALEVTPVMENGNARVKIQAHVTGTPDEVRVMIDGEGEAAANRRWQNYRAVLSIPDAHLWNGVKDPYLYTARAVLYKNGEAVDEVSTRFGCRSFSFDPEKGFFLNGVSYPLHGVSRHQDRAGVGNALTPEMHRQDMEIIAGMGANTIRLAHYQHDQLFYDLCDEYGMVVWAEIPYISEHMPDGRDNTISQMTELVLQNYNHPSIVCWGLSNEISITGVTADLLENHRLLNGLVHKLDETRPTAMAHAFMLDPGEELASLPDISSYNLYYGWYVGELSDNDEWFDDFHARYPDRIIGLSEYGADACPKWQTSSPERSDYTEQYQCVYHEHMLELFRKRPYIWATHLWNMFDFGADGRDEGGEHGLNQKGLVTIDRKLKKDAYYLYKAYWSEEAFVHICGSRYVDRAEEVTEVKVYSNQSRVALYSNGVLVEEKEGDKIFLFRVPLGSEQELEARAGDLVDSIRIRKVEQPNQDYMLAGGSVHNWFDEPGMEIREGYFSIMDSMEDICSVPAGAAMIGKMMETARAARGDVAQNVKMSESMQRMMNRMSVEKMIKQAGGSIPREMVIQLNQALCRIPKPKKG